MIIICPETTELPSEVRQMHDIYSIEDLMKKSKASIGSTILEFLHREYHRRLDYEKSWDLTFNELPHLIIGLDQDGLSSRELTSVESITDINWRDYDKF